MSGLATLGLVEINARDLAPSTKEVYADLVERHAMPGLGALKIHEVAVPSRTASSR